MNGKQLRNSILQWAISGRLVPQDPTDEPASELLKRINPKAAPLSPDDAPFTIPDSWCWCRFSQIVKFRIGKTPPRGDTLYWENGVENWVSISDMTEYGHINTTKEKVSQNSKAIMGDVSPIGTLIMSFKLTVGRTSILEIPSYHNEAIISIFPYIDEDNALRNYLFYILPVVSNYGESKDAIKGKTLNSKSMSDLLIPLPPLAEQERIVGKVEELLPLVERYDKAQTDLDRLNASLKGKLRASVLQEAISGRLVPQDPTDEPAIELLKRINPKFTPQPTEELLPAGWTACTLEDIVEIKDNLRQPINSAERNKRIAGKKESELYPYYGATGQVGYIDKYLMDGKYLLLGEDGAPFLDKMANKAYIVEGKCWVNNHAHVLLPHCNTEYMCLYLNQFSYYSYVTGSTRLKLTQASMKKMPVLVPPLAEQERIVGKVEELFAVLDALQ